MDLSDLTIQPGKVHLVREILQDGVTGSVRVLGRYGPHRYFESIRGLAKSQHRSQLMVSSTPLCTRHKAERKTHKYTCKTNQGPGREVSRPQTFLDWILGTLRQRLDVADGLTTLLCRVSLWRISTTM